MKLLRTGPRGSELPTTLGEDGLLRALSPAGQDITSEAIAAWAAGKAIQVGDPLAPTEQRVGAPLRRPGKVVCVGLNYLAHAHEANQPVPTEPVLFMKSGDIVTGPRDSIGIPNGSEKTDYEVELGVVIGRTARCLSVTDQPLDYVFGYVLANDVSERAYQLEHGGSWDKGKNCDDFLPLGPWLVTADEVPFPQAIALETRVNGELRQSSSTADMIFPVDHLVWYISQFITLQPGDLVLTGTPHGVGAGFSPTRFLTPGDVVEMSASGLGGQRNVFIAGGGT